LANYNIPFTGKSCLPRNGQGFLSIPQSGIVSSTALSDYVATLQRDWPAKPLSVSDLSSRDSQVNNPNVIINSGNLDPAKTFSDNAKGLRESIQNEYCYYYNRYIWGLRDVLTKAAAGTTGASYNDEKVEVSKLNSKLNQILQILQALTTARTDTVNSYYSSDATVKGVNTLNTELTTLSSQLKDHSEQLQSKSLEQNVQSAMIDYSLEKNASSRNLLGIYGFMNIVAIGFLFYLYRSSKV